MNRPHAFILKETKLKFPKVPFHHKPLKMVIPDLDFPIPLISGHVCYLTLPANYNKFDLDIVKTVVTAHLKNKMECEEERKKSVFGAYLDRVVKNKTIVSVHY